MSVMNRLLGFYGVHVPFIHSYLDDVLVLPIVLGIMLLLFRKYIVLDEHYQFPFMYVIASVMLYASVFEYYLPKHSVRFTSDPLDIAAYALGGLFFFFFMNGNAELETQVQK